MYPLDTLDMSWGKCHFVIKLKFFLRFILLLGWILVGLAWLVIFNKFFSNNVYKKTLVNFGKVFVAICGAKVSLKNGQNINFLKNVIQ